MSKSTRGAKVVPLQGVLHRPDGSRVLHPASYERCPPPPKWLDKQAKALWRKIAPEMHRRCILTVIDTSSVAAYCSVVTRAEALDAAGNTEAAEMWHEADEWAAMLLIDPPKRPAHPAPTAPRSPSNPPRTPGDRPAA